MGGNLEMLLINVFAVTKRATKKTTDKNSIETLFNRNMLGRAFLEFHR